MPSSSRASVRAATGFGLLVALGCLACAPPQSVVERPNVVLIVVDTLRADAVGWYRRGASVTAFLDAQVELGGVVFRRAYASAPATSPSVASLFTSRYLSQHGVVVNGSGALAPAEHTLAEVFREAGYATGAVTANFIMKPERGFAQGFQHYEMLMGKPPARKLGGGHVNRAVLEWLDEVQASPAPIFLYVQYLEPHIPYQAGRIAREKTAQLLPNAASFPGKLDYATEVLSVDIWIRELWRELDARGLLEKAIVVVTADHGEQFLDHGSLLHSNSLYDEEVHVPLAVFMPGMRGRRDVQAVVSLLDLGPTLLELVGIDAPESFEGRSFRGLLEGAEDPAGERTAYLERDKRGAAPPYGDHRRGVVVGSYKVIEHRNRELEFYDLSVDPGELRSGEMSRGRREALLDELAAARERSQRNASVPVATEPDAEDLEALRSLGYVDEAPPAPSRPPGLPDASSRGHHP